MKITVTCYSGYRVDEKPQRIRFDSSEVTVNRILDQWLDPDHRYFKCLGNDGGIYIVRQDMNALEWTLTYYQDASRGKSDDETGSIS